MSRDIRNGNSNHRPLKRRQFLQYAAVSSGLLLAGCLGNDGEGGPDPGTLGNFTDRGEEDFDAENLDHVDQEFRMPMCRRLDEVNWFHVDEHGFMEWEYFTYEHGAWGAWSISDYKGMGELNYRQFADVVTEDDRIEITIRDDVNWSTGDPVLGRDAVIGPIQKRLRKGARTFEEVEAKGPVYPSEAITDFEFDGKTGILYSDGGHFGELLDQTIWNDLLLHQGPRFPTTMEPWEEYAEFVFTVMEMAVDGEIDPWEANGPTTRNDIQDHIFGKDRDHLHERFRDPDEVVVNGAWTLEEIRGEKELWLQPNEEHRYADRINFDRIVLEPACDGHDVWSSLQAEHYDFAEANPPPHTIDEFPAQYEIQQVPDLGGASFELNLSQDVAENVRARQAIFAAMDKAAIAEIVNPVTHEPLHVPGGDNFGVPDVISDAWIEENLQSYEYDPEFAADLMREGGYERDSGGTWVDGDGEQAELTIYTTAGSPELEPLVADQLSEFGFIAEYQTLEHATLEDNMDRGEIPIWTGSAGAGSVYSALGSYEYALHHENVMRRHAYFDGTVEEQLEQTEWDEEGWLATQDPDDLEHLTVSVPPIGDFWAEESTWEPFPVVSMYRRMDTTTGEEFADLWRQLLWIYNWHLPALPYAKTYTTRFLNTENWHWSRDHDVWEYLGIRDRLIHQDLFSWGDMIYADPENPKE